MGRDGAAESHPTSRKVTMTIHLRKIFQLEKMILKIRFGPYLNSILSFDIHIKTILSE